jgi:hypothetical protein
MVSWYAYVSEKLAAPKLNKKIFNFVKAILTLETLLYEGENG